MRFAGDGREVGRWDSRRVSSDVGQRWRRRKGGSGGGSRAAAATQGWRRRKGGGGNNGILVAGARSDGGRGGGGNNDILVAGARSGGGRGGGGGDGGWTPSPDFREQPLEMEETPFFSQMTARVCGGGGGGGGGGGSLPLL